MRVVGSVMEQQVSLWPLGQLCLFQFFPVPPHVLAAVLSRRKSLGVGPDLSLLLEAQCWLCSSGGRQSPILMCVGRDLERLAGEVLGQVLGSRLQVFSSTVGEACNSRGVSPHD